MTYTVNPFGVAFVHVRNSLRKEKHMAQTKISTDSTRNKGNNKITELRTILQRESQNS